MKGIIKEVAGVVGCWLRDERQVEVSASRASGMNRQVLTTSHMASDGRKLGGEKAPERRSNAKSQPLDLQQEKKQKLVRWRPSVAEVVINKKAVYKKKKKKANWSTTALSSSG